MNQPSFRAELLTRRTYNRPKKDGTFETWEETVDRVIDHQKWLWERAQGESLNYNQLTELEELRDLILDRKVSLSGRTLWLGGTETAKKYEASQFNCAFLNIETVTDVVDAYWLLLQGCGVGFKPVSGTLSGFTTELYDEHRYYDNEDLKIHGRPDNDEYDTGAIHKIIIGDSAAAWAKAIGKILSYKGSPSALVIDYRQIRPAGIRLKGYGWVSQGADPLKKAIEGICKIMNKRAGELLTKMDILDIMNLIGTTLSSRRSAEICLMDYDDPEVYDFMTAKKDMFERGLEHRAQSNNSIIFNKKPSRMELKGIFQTMLDSGGSEPGFINGEAARERAPWFKGVNPCGEILLGNKSFCNLVEVDLAKFDFGDTNVVIEAIRLVARANYRQTCVDLRDGVLSDSWHELNSYLRLCGVGLTGLQKNNPYYYSNMLRRNAIWAANEMADELGLPKPKAVTTIKPSGTLSKIMDTTEGIHKPLGKYIFNNVNFDKDDPLVQQLKDANYNVFDNPYDEKNVLVTLPVCYEGVRFGCREGKEVNIDTALHQLRDYRDMMKDYVQHNCSITVSYTPDEVDEIVEFLLDNWNDYVGVSFILRNDPTKTAEDLGYPYLPQEVVTKETYDEYVSKLLPVTISNIVHGNELEPDSDCEGGTCPVR